MVVSEWERRPPDQEGGLERQLTSSMCTFLPCGVHFYHVEERSEEVTYSETALKLEVVLPSQ